MHSFQDKHGLEWLVDLTLDKAMAIEGHNFAQALGEDPLLDEDGNEQYLVRRIRFIDPEESLFTEKLTNSRVLLDMLWCCLRDQAAKGGITNVLQFAERFDGKSFDAARMAFLEELPCFFPRKAMTLRALIAKYSEAEIATDRATAQQIEETMGAENVQKLLSKAHSQARRELAKILAD